MMASLGVSLSRQRERHQNVRSQNYIRRWLALINRTAVCLARASTSFLTVNPRVDSWMTRPSRAMTGCGGDPRSFSVSAARETSEVSIADPHPSIASVARPDSRGPSPRVTECCGGARRLGVIRLRKTSEVPMREPHFCFPAWLSRALVNTRTAIRECRETFPSHLQLVLLKRNSQP